MMAGNWSVGGKTLAMDGNLFTVLPGTGTPAAAAVAEPPSTSTAPATTPALPAPPANPGTLVQIGTVTGGKFALYDNAVRRPSARNHQFTSRNREFGVEYLVLSD